MIQFDVSAKRGVLVLLLVGAAVRLLVVAAGGVPARFSDTAEYEALAHRIAAGNLAGNDGFHTPGYPLVMLLCGLDDRIVVALQMTLGLATSLALFFAFRAVTGSAVVGLLAGLSQSLNVSQVLYETSIMTETTTTFVVVLVFLLVFRSVCDSTPRPPAWFALLGLLCAAAALVRPICALVPFAAFAYYVATLLRLRVSLRPAATRLACFLAPVVLLLGGWSGINYRTSGYFALSTLTGANLTHWSGQFIELAPDEYAEIKQIYARHRNEAGTSRQTVWGALPEIRSRTGMSDAQISDAMKRMSLLIIPQKFGSYAATAARSWAAFWKPQSLRDDAIPRAVVLASAAVIVALEFVFLLAPFAWIASRRVRLQIPNPLPWALVYTLILGTSITQALLICVENSRYGIVTNSLTVGTAIYALSVLFAAFSNSPRRSDG